MFVQWFLSLVLVLSNLQTYSCSFIFIGSFELIDTEGKKGILVELLFIKQQFWFLCPTFNLENVSCVSTIFAFCGEIKPNCEKSKQNCKHERKVWIIQIIMVGFLCSTSSKASLKIDEKWTRMIYNTNKNINKVFNKLYQHFQTYV